MLVLNPATNWHKLWRLIHWICQSFWQKKSTKIFFKDGYCHMIMFHFKDQSLGQLISLCGTYISVSHFYHTCHLGLIQQGLCIYVPVFHNKCVQVTSEASLSLHFTTWWQWTVQRALASQDSFFIAIWMKNWTFIQTTGRHIRNTLGTLQVVSFLVFCRLGARNWQKMHLQSFNAIFSTPMHTSWHH